MFRHDLQSDSAQDIKKKKKKKKKKTYSNESIWFE
jgi:hypothetical protein